MDAKLLNAIRGDDLIAYFEFLDRLRDSGRTNMNGAPRYLMSTFAMAKAEAFTVFQAWRSTFSETLPAVDRALQALEPTS